jgi:hypothetical protein
MFNNRIIIGLVTLLLLCFLTIGLLFKLYKTEKEERIRYNNNMLALIENKSRQQELTIAEFKKLYPKYDSIANRLNIKTKHITDVIDTRYRFKDTTLVSSVLTKDSVSEKSYFTFSDDCYNISGFVKKDSVSLTNREIKDKITIFSHKDWEKKYLWGLIKLKPFMNVKVYSECKKDTIQVINNIKLK